MLKNVVHILPLRIRTVPVESETVGVPSSENPTQDISDFGVNGNGSLAIKGNNPVPLRIRRMEYEMH